MLALREGSTIWPAATLVLPSRRCTRRWTRTSGSITTRSSSTSWAGSRRKCSRRNSSKFYFFKKNCSQMAFTAKYFLTSEIPKKMPALRFCWRFSAYGGKKRQNAHIKTPFLRSAITIAKKNCKPTPNKNPVTSLITLLDSWKWKACKKPSRTNGRSKRTDQIVSILYWYLTHTNPTTPPIRIPRHREQKIFSSPKNQMLRSFLLWQKHNPNLLFSIFRNNIGPISVSHSKDNSSKTINFQ